jgi:hypothetical protein
MAGCQATREVPENLRIMGHNCKRKGPFLLELTHKPSRSKRFENTTKKTKNLIDPLANI